MLKMPFPSFIGQTSGEIPIFGTYLGKFSILAYVLLKEEETHSYTLVANIRLKAFNIENPGGLQHPPLENVLQKMSQEDDG